MRAWQFLGSVALGLLIASVFYYGAEIDDFLREHYNDNRWAHVAVWVGSYLAGFAIVARIKDRRAKRRGQLESQPPAPGPQ